MCGVITGRGRPDYIFGQCDAAMRNTGTGFVVLSHHSLFTVFEAFLFINEKYSASSYRGGFFT